MTKEMLMETIKAVVEGYGFETSYHSRYGFELKIEDPTETVHVWIDSAERVYSKDYTTVTETLVVRGCVRGCGGNPSADDLFKTGTRIAQTAAMLKVLEGMNFTYTENI